MIRLPRPRHSFPTAPQKEIKANSWGNQWAHLPHLKGRLVRIANKLRIMRTD